MASNASILEYFVDVALNLPIFDAHRRQNYIHALDSLQLEGGLEKSVLARTCLVLLLLARFEVFAGAHLLTDGAQTEAALVRLSLFDGHGVRLRLTRLP